MNASKVKECSLACYPLAFEVAVNLVDTIANTIDAAFPPTMICREKQRRL